MTHSLLNRRPRLVHITDDQAGYHRKKWGRGFTYIDSSNQRITDAELKARFEALVIPPAWTDVWICPKPDGYLQATGRDEKGRKQYIYHEKWLQYRQAKKFQHLEVFASALPIIRKTTQAHLRKKTWTKEKVLALAVRILDETGMRIGNEVYRQRNNTYGLTTIRRKHLTAEEKQLVFTFRGKSGQDRQVGIEDPRLIKLIRECSELPGYEVFRYRDEQGHFQSIDSQDVNEYLQSITEDDFSSKDFRTWTATVAMVDYFPEVYSVLNEQEQTRRQLLPTLIKMVAQRLGNTPAVCRDYYVHPAVLAAIEKNNIPSFDSINQSFSDDFIEMMDPEELVTLSLIRQASSH